MSDCPDRFEQGQEAPVVLGQVGEQPGQTDLRDVAAARVAVRVVPSGERPECAAQLGCRKVHRQIRPETDQLTKSVHLTRRQRP